MSTGHHPLLKQLKAYVRTLCCDDGGGSSGSAPVTVTDKHECLVPLCRLMEDILAYGLRPKCGSSSTGVGGGGSSAAWHCMQTLAARCSTQQISGRLWATIDAVHKSNKVSTSAGRLRLFVRCALNEQLLQRAVNALRAQRWLLNVGGPSAICIFTLNRQLRHRPFECIDCVQEFYSDSSLLCDDIGSEVLLSLLATLQCRVAFALRTASAAFLDQTWILPTYRSYELVPCEQLGVELVAVHGRLIIVTVELGSVADEDLKLEPGDVLCELYGESMLGCSVRRAVELMADYRSCPVYVAVAKALDGRNHFYAPLRGYLDAAGLTVDEIKSRRHSRVAELHGIEGASAVKGTRLAAAAAVGAVVTDAAPHGADERHDGVERYTVRCVGAVPVGPVGTVEQIECGVVDALRTHAHSDKATVRLAITETGLTVRHAHTRQVLLSHGFPEISSCGRRVDHPTNFAFIAGETVCSSASHFVCHVFEADTVAVARDILRSIAEGFERTHWAV